MRSGSVKLRSSMKRSTPIPYSLRKRSANPSISSRISALSTRKGRKSVTNRRNSSLSCWTVFCRLPSSAQACSGVCVDLLAQHSELNIQAQERLQDTVVQIARDAASLGFHGPRSEVTQEKNVLEWRPQVPHDLLEPSKISL